MTAYYSNSISGTDWRVRYACTNKRLAWYGARVTEKGPIPGMGIVNGADGPGVPIMFICVN